MHIGRQQEQLMEEVAKPQWQMGLAQVSVSLEGQGVDTTRSCLLSGRHSCNFCPLHLVIPSGVLSSGNAAICCDRACCSTHTCHISLSVGRGLGLHRQKGSYGEENSEPVVAMMRERSIRGISCTFRTAAPGSYPPRPVRLHIPLASSQ